MKNTLKEANMRLVETFCTIAVTALGFSSCEPFEPEHKPMPCEPYALTKSQSEMVNDGNAFAFNLLGKIYEAPDFQGKDFMVSPLSISFVLGALDNGATGETSNEIHSVLGFGDYLADEINEYSKTILQGCPGVDNLVNVKMANAVFVKEGYEFKEGFSNALSTYYDAYVKSMKFDTGALDDINGWCKEKTEGLIPKIIDKIPDEACLFALNSIYFKGDWAEKFEKGDTEKAGFTNFDGTSGTAWMMHMEDRFTYSANDVWATVRLPYGNGSYSMYVLLPHKGKSIEDMMAVLNAQTWESEKNSMRSNTVDLKLPKFETETDINLIDIMKSLGMEKAFEASQAEFGEMFTKTNGNVHLGLLKQKSKIIVNEDGTEAAAVTIGGMVDSAGPPELPQIIEFHADRPFVYLIQEMSSNAIFFIGAKVRS